MGNMYNVLFFVPASIVIKMHAVKTNRNRMTEIKERRDAKTPQFAWSCYIYSSPFSGEGFCCRRINPQSFHSKEIKCIKNLSRTLNLQPLLNKKKSCNIYAINPYMDDMISGDHIS